jgi:hypothetical protein
VAAGRSARHGGLPGSRYRPPMSSLASPAPVAATACATRRAPSSAWSASPSCSANGARRPSLSSAGMRGRRWPMPWASAGGKAPAKSTLSRFLRAPDAQAVEQAPSRRAEGAGLVSPDGKVLKGSRDGETPGRHPLCAYAPHVQAVPARARVEAAHQRTQGRAAPAGPFAPGRAGPPAGRRLRADRQGRPGGLAADIGAGFGFEAAQRSAAAATGREPASSPGAGGPPGQHGGRGARPAGEADLADDDDPGAAPEVAGPGPGV